MTPNSAAPLGFIVFSGPFVSNSAGIECLHRLCHELNERGFSSFTTGGTVEAPHLNAPIIDLQSAQLLCALGYVAIYPETISGNPLGAKTVVRWVLNRPGLLGGDEVYTDSEVIFSYSDAFTPYVKNRVCGKLYMPTINERLFYCDDPDLSQRSLACFYVGKSEWKPGIVDRDQAFEITRENPNKQELGKLFRASRVLYCFDNSTILIYEALLCGCPVVIVPDGTQTRHDFEELELGMDGISWGPAGYRESNFSLSDLRTRYSAAKRELPHQIEELIAACQKRAGTCSAAQLEQRIKAEAKLKRQRMPRSKLQHSAHRIIKYGRKTEQKMRRFRKRVLKKMRGQNADSQHWEHDNGFFHCSDHDLNKRALECYFNGGEPARSKQFDPDEVMQVSPSTSVAQLAVLFRASRRFYCFDRNSRLIGYAEACGCPVTLIKGRRHRVSFEKPRSLSKSPNTLVKVSRSSRDEVVTTVINHANTLA
ncbi:MAG TPA: hypothetical protein VMZ30_17595 [Pyrinomonadaceae bacterium]|nr:hypothetical protein [Pyrinomonadaceae bacterium]